MRKGRSARAGAGFNTGIQANDADIRELVSLYAAGNLKQAETRARRLIAEFPATLVAYNVLGAAQSGQGKPKKAIASYRQALKVNPDYVDAHYNLGNTFKALGKLGSAAASYRQAIKLKPDFAEAHINLGILLKDMGKPEGAISSYRQALKLMPLQPDIHSNLGNALLELGRNEEAIAAYRQSIKVKPDHAEGHFGLANVLQAAGESEAAVAAYRAAVKIMPSHVEALCNLGRVLTGLGRLEEAAASLALAVKINPGFALAHHNLGTALIELDAFEDAAAAFECALDADPGLAASHASLGMLHERLNDLDKALEHTQRARELVPDDPAALLSWAVIQKRKGDRQGAIETLTPLAKRGAPGNIGAQIHSELGKLHDREGDCTRAFDCFRAANDLQAQSESAARYSKAAFLEEVEEIGKALSAGGEWKQWAGDDAGETPSFIVGFPRSGTTLLDQILDAHPVIQVMEEQAALDHVVAHIAEAHGAYPSILGELTVEAVSDLRMRYFANVERSITRQPGTLLVDKYPLNIRHIPLILRLFPNAGIILAMRHPCDVILSNFMQAYKINDAMANFFTLEDAAHCYARVMGLWQNCTELLPVKFHMVKYEALVGDFDTEVRGLLEFLGVGWDEAVLGHIEHAKARGVINTPSYQSVTEPIYQRAKYRWKRYQREIEPVLGELQPFIEAFGYSDQPT